MELVPVGPVDAKIYLVGDMPSIDEEKLGKPFQGSSGRLLEHVLGQAGISRTSCRFSYVMRARPYKNNLGFYFKDSKKTCPTDTLQHWVDKLHEDIKATKPNVIIALGAWALHFLTGEKGVDKNRGTFIPCKLLPEYKVLSTYHPSAILQTWEKAFPFYMDLRKANRNSLSKALPKDKRVLKINASVDEWEAYCDFLLTDDAGPWYSLDLETLINPKPYITWIGLGHSADYAVNIKILGSLNFTDQKAPLLTENEEIRVWKALAKVLASSKGCIAQNMHFEESILLKYHNIRIANRYMDTMIAAHVCWTGLPKDLGFLASLATDRSAWKSMSKTDMGRYNALDVANTYEIAEFFTRELPIYKALDTFNFEMQQLDLTLMMEAQGIYVDKVDMEERRKKLTIELEAIKERIFLEAGVTINLNSPTQVKNLLYTTLKLPTIYARRKAGESERKISTDEEALTKLVNLTNHQVPKDLLLYRKTNKILTNYLNFPVSPESRIHTSYNITGTESGRWSSGKSIAYPYGPGNLQNVPSSVRPMFKAEPGKVFIQADLIQAEAVVVAFLSNDQVLKRAFANGEDIHKLTASMMFGKALDAIVPKERQIGKTIRHAGNYSSGPGVIAVNIPCEMAEAKKLLSLYHAANPSLKVWHESIKNELKANSTLTTPVGRTRKFFARPGDDLDRSAISFKPQSTVADIMNAGIVDFYTQYGDEYILSLQLHDALYVQCNDNLPDILVCVQRMRNCLTRPVPIGFETMVIEVDFAMGYAWGGQTKMEELIKSEGKYLKTEEVLRTAIDNNCTTFSELVTAYA
jgi:uracil-DNA glycosylase family 4